MRLTASFLSLVLALASAAPASAGEEPSFFSFDGSRGAYLGVQLSDLDGDAARDLGLSGSSGVRIERVLEDTAAADAGLEDGDVVLSFDGERVRSAEHLGRLVRETAPGREVAVLVLRDGRERSFEVTPREREAAGFFAPRAPMPAMPAVPSVAPFAAEALERALFFGGGARWRLGIQGDDLSSQLAGFFEVDQGSGVLVEEVVSGSAAEKAGLRAGDVIVGLDDERLESLADLRRLLADDERDAAASIVIIRKGRERSLPVELEKIERTGRWFAGDPEAARELRERHALEAEKYREQADRMRAEQEELRRSLREQARELRENQREIQRELQRELREAQRGMRFARPAPIAAPAPGAAPAPRVAPAPLGRPAPAPAPTRGRVPLTSLPL